MQTRRTWQRSWQPLPSNPRTPPPKNSFCSSVNSPSSSPKFRVSRRQVGAGRRFQRLYPGDSLSLLPCLMLSLPYLGWRRIAACQKYGRCLWARSWFDPPLILPSATQPLLFYPCQGHSFPVDCPRAEAGQTISGTFYPPTGQSNFLKVLALPAFTDFPRGTISSEENRLARQPSLLFSSLSSFTYTLPRESRIEVVRKSPRPIPEELIISFDIHVSLLEVPGQAYPLITPDTTLLLPDPALLVVSIVNFDSLL